MVTAVPPSPTTDDTSWREELGLDGRSLGRLAFGLVLLLGVSALAAILLREPLTTLAAWFMREMGLLGLFVGVVCTDIWVAPPLTHEPLLFFAHAGGVPFVEIWGVASAASVVAGPIGYLAGALLGRLPFVDRRLNGSGVEKVMARRGAIVVAAAAITPIPFAMTTWLAGAVGVRPLPFFAACLVRVIKVALYLGLIALGWGVV